MLKKRSYETEKTAFRSLKERLLSDEKYAGKYVAIVGGEVKDVDSDERELVRRIYKNVGYVPMSMGRVERKKRRIEFSSPERM